MRSEFSETQFVFGIVREMADGLKPDVMGMPIFPTLVEEGRKGGGFDVAFKDGINPYFFQFKIAEKLIGHKARESAYFSGSPYYRFNIYPSGISRQNSLLTDLSNDEKNNVFYCAPAFTSLNNFRKAYTQKSILNNSVFVDIREINIPTDNETHSVCYQVDPVEKYIVCSEPKEITGIYGWKKLSVVNKGQNRQHGYENIFDFLDDMYSVLEKNKIHVDYDIQNDIMDYRCCCRFREKKSCFCGCCEKQLYQQHKAISYLTNNENLSDKLYAVTQTLSMLGITTCFM